MIKAVIIEDEKLALDNIVNELKTAGPAIEIMVTLSSVKESIEWFNANHNYNLIFLDIQLSDGLSFNIFNNCRIRCPVIFITAYDDYFMKAFEFNGIDYLLKPVDSDKLKNSLNKYKKLENHFLGDYTFMMDYFRNQDKKRTRIIAKKGSEFISIKTEDIVCFFSEHKLVFLIDREGKRYLTEQNNLIDLSDQLDNKLFYRANRKYIVNINFIKKFRSRDRNKIEIELNVNLDEEIIVSQENASSFKKWISDT